MLSAEGNIDTAAERLFAAMREMDATRCRILIIAESLPEGRLAGDL
jgi:hypothetical protein